LLFLYIVYNVTYIDVSYIVITSFTVRSFTLTLVAVTTDRCLRLFGNRIIAFPFVLLHRRGVDDPVSRRRPSRRCVGMFTKEKMLSSLL
jgi:hypothetical protein